ncbi:hypothetical protein FMEAI12_4320037 [Parafrankia sp. Ea1.12]|nr:hypothetical protein FMEAI12_4320037 [Parafrankia sp. Ea1.12]
MLPAQHDQVTGRGAVVPRVPVSEFVRFRFPTEVIVLVVRWYLRFAPSYEGTPAADARTETATVRPDHQRRTCLDPEHPPQPPRARCRHRPETAAGCRVHRTRRRRLTESHRGHWHALHPPNGTVPAGRRDPPGATAGDGN